MPATEPVQDRDLGGLHPVFAAAVGGFVVLANRHLPAGFELRVGECRRTEARQAWLYALGRTLPGPKRSWTMDSRHRYGLAADLILVDLGADLASSADDTADWSQELWRGLYAAVPPELFGLTTVPQELVHLELAAADALIARAETLGVQQT